MLKYVSQYFKINQEYWTSEPNDTINNLFNGYKDALISEGYFIRKDTPLLKNPDETTIVISGILSSSTALDDAEKDEKIKEYLFKIRKYLTEPVVNLLFNTSLEYDYCSHGQWRRLTLQNDHISRVPSLLCGDCGGIIPSYRLNLDQNVKIKLWDWERSSDAIGDLSSLCGAYESWADNEISDRSSRINQLGFDLAKLLTQFLGIDVDYFFEKD